MIAGVRAASALIREDDRRGIELVGGVATIALRKGDQRGRGRGLQRRPGRHDHGGPGAQQTAGLLDRRARVGRAVEGEQDRAGGRHVDIMTGDSGRRALLTAVPFGP